jgi:predicted dehydrogenase
MLAADAVDAVVVVTRRPATGPVVLDALEAGKHVLSEKPMAHTVAQAQRLVDAARAKRLLYAIGFMKRHDAGVALARQHYDRLKASGELGAVILMRVWSFNGEFNLVRDGFVMTEETRPEGLELWPIAPDWMPSPHHADFAWFLNVFIHDLNILRYFIGHKPRVAAVDLSRRNGRVVIFDCGPYAAVLEMGEQSGTRWNEGVEIVFEKGRLSIAFASPLLKEAAQVTLTRGTTPEVLAAEPSWSFRRQAEAFIADIRTGQEPLASGADSLADMELAEEIWRAHLRI